MSHIVTFLQYLSIAQLCFGCGHPKLPAGTEHRTRSSTAIHFTGESYELWRNGQPYFIKGAGGTGYFDRLKACGGNSIRIWQDTDADQILDQAHALGMTVTLGLWVEREIEGFDYKDKPAVDRQFEQIKKAVLTYRHHPALLMWSVGNECVLDANDLTVYDEINRITRMIHELDPNHPVTTVISLDSERAVWLARERCPDIDILSVNVYGDINRMHQFLKGGGWTGPYLISEYGALGYWETPKTPWNTPIEPTSRQKYEFIETNYQAYIGSKPSNCLGAYLFLWGTKQEETHTWFSFFDEQGRETALVGLMQQLWLNKPAANKAPEIRQLLVDQSAQTSMSFSFTPAVHSAQLLADDPEGDSLTYRWEIRRAARQRSDYNNTPIPVADGLINSSAGPVMTFSLPPQPGAYRLFAYVYDTHKHITSTNLAFRVMPTRTDKLNLN